MKKSKLSKKRKGRGKDPVQTKNVNVDLRDDETIISEMLRSQEINANVTTCADQRRNSGDSNDENTFSTSTSAKDANENSTGEKELSTTFFTFHFSGGIIPIRLETYVEFN